LALVPLTVLAACADPALTPPDDGTPPPGVSVSISGNRLRGLRIADSLVLDARWQGAGSSDSAVPAITWSVSDSGMVQVSSNGVVRALAAGYARVRAHAGTATDSVWVRVELEQPADHVFHFEFDATVSAMHQRAALRAAERWARIVRGPLEPLTLDLARDACSRPLSWPRAVVGAEPGVRVLVASGNYTSPAGTALCHRRSNGLSAVAVIGVSTDPQFAWYGESMWTTIWIHELGHALGLVADLVSAPGSRIATPGFVSGYVHDHGRVPTNVVWDQLGHWGGLPGDIMDGNTGPSRATVIGRATAGRLLDMGYPVELRQSGPIDVAAVSGSADKP